MKTNFVRALENDGDNEDCNEKYIATNFVLFINISNETD